MLELVPPGRIIFLRPLKREGTRVAWDAVWIKAEELIREVRALGIALLSCFPLESKTKIQNLLSSSMRASAGLLSQQASICTAPFHMYIIIAWLQIS